MQRKEPKNKVETDKKDQKKTLGSSEFNYNFTIGTFKKSIFQEFVSNKVLNELNITQPIPPEVGKLQFRVYRKKSLIGSTTFNLYLEVNDTKKFLLLRGYSKALKGQSYYMI